MPPSPQVQQGTKASFSVLPTECRQQTLAHVLHDACALKKWQLGPRRLRNAHATAESKAHASFCRTTLELRVLNDGVKLAGLLEAMEILQSAFDPTILLPPMRAVLDCLQTAKHAFEGAVKFLETELE